MPSIPPNVLPATDRPTRPAVPANAPPQPYPAPAPAQGPSFQETLNRLKPKRRATAAEAPPDARAERTRASRSAPKRSARQTAGAQGSSAPAKRESAAADNRPDEVSEASHAGHASGARRAESARAGDRPTQAADDPAPGEIAETAAGDAVTDAQQGDGGSTAELPVGETQEAEDGERPSAEGETDQAEAETDLIVGQSDPTAAVAAATGADTLIGDALPAGTPTGSTEDSADAHAAGGPGAAGGQSPPVAANGNSASRPRTDAVGQEADEGATGSPAADHAGTAAPQALEGEAGANAADDGLPAAPGVADETQSPNPSNAATGAANRQGGELSEWAARLTGPAGGTPPAPSPGIPAPGAVPATGAAPEVRFAEENHPAIVKSIRQELLPSGGTMRLRLDPPELGAMQVTVRLRDGAMTASFETSSDQATSLLSHSLGQLKAALESQGVQVDRLHVQQSPREQQPSQQQGDRQQQDQGNPQDHPTQREQQRREMLRRMWRRLAGGQDPLDLVA